MSVLGHDNVTANGNVTIPTDCVYVVALCTGSLDPPYLNGNKMQTVASVPATGINKAVSIHVSTFPIVATLPFVMNGADTITWVYLDNAVCTRADVVQGYSNTSGGVTGALATSTSDLVLGIVLGSNGQVQIKGDTVAMTLLDNTLKRCIGWIAPGDASLTCIATDNSTVSGYWYSPPAVWHDTTTSVLVEAGHYVFNPVQHTRTFVFHVWIGGSNYVYRVYIDGVYSFDTTFQSNIPETWTEVFYTYPGVWVPDRYETVASGYWEYPAQQWIETGVAGEVSAAWISIADVMIGGIYVSRPLVC
jgi:hypothetical protein